MSLREKLHAAWKCSDLTLEQLRERTGLDLTLVSLGRKLRGKQAMRVEESEALAVALGVSLSVGRKRSRRAA